MRDPLVGYDKFVGGVRDDQNTVRLAQTELSTYHARFRVTKQKRYRFVNETASSDGIRRVCVYCGSASGNRQSFVDAAAQLGQRMAEQRLTLVYGGGQVGLMGVLADACLAAGGKVIGVIPDRLATVELKHEGCTEMHVVPDMHSRKALMADFADAFVALPGGIGTFEEFFEAMTWRQIGYHNKPVLLANIDGFYDPLIALLEETERDGFLRKPFLDVPLFETVGTVDELMGKLAGGARN